MATERKGCLAALFRGLGARGSTSASGTAESQSARQLPYRLRASLLTNAELSFYRSLLTVVGSQYAVLSKVRVGDLLDVTDRELNQGAFNRISAKHIDFVLCDPVTLAPLKAVELDDSTHARARRVARDAFLDEALHTAGLPLVRAKVQAHYDVVELRRLLELPNGLFPN